MLRDASRAVAAIIAAMIAAMIAAGASTAASAAALKIVPVASPGINCAYHPNCVVIATDSTGDIPIPGFVQGGIVQTRTFLGNPGTPAAGKYAYQYRISMEQAAARSAPCATALLIDFGPMLKLRYSKSEAPADVHVISSGGPGSISLASADQVGRQIFFAFARPICVGETFDRSESSFFFGMTANGAPRDGTAHLQMTGGRSLAVPVRLPAGEPASAQRPKKKR